MKDAASFIAVVVGLEQVDDVTTDGLGKPADGAALGITAVNLVEPLAGNTHLLGYIVNVRVEDAA